MRVCSNGVPWITTLSAPNLRTKPSLPVRVIYSLKEICQNSMYADDTIAVVTLEYNKWDLEAFGKV